MSQSLSNLGVSPELIAMPAAIDEQGPALAPGGDGGDLADVLGRVLDGLSSATAAEPRRFFPYGVTEIAITLPGGASVTVRGPTQGTADEAATPYEYEEDDHDTVCEAPDTDDSAMGAAPADPVDTELPASTTTLYAFGPAAKRFATAKTIRAVEAIAAAYFAATGIRLGVGNISLRAGGPMPPHASHQKGCDVDLRVPRRDARESAATWRDPAYSRSRTQQLVNIVRANSIKSVRVILFNDTGVPGVQSFRGHDNHLHVSFNV
jgi:hypothetical protein